MKTILIAISIICLGCSKFSSPDKTDALFVIFDATDSFSETNNFKACQVRSFLPMLNGQRTHGSVVKFLSITNQRFNEDKTISINAINSFTSNEIDRLSEIKRMNKSIDSFVKILNNLPKGYPNSLVFYTLYHAIDEISSLPITGTKQVLILSDCRENSDLFTTYKPDFLEVLKAHPDTISKVFEGNYRIKRSLIGIKITIVHKPNLQEDELFFLLSSALRKYLVSKGAEVEILTNL